MNLKAAERQDLKSFLAMGLSISKSRAKELIDSKQVFVNNKRIWIATYELKAGDTVVLDTPETAPKGQKINILFEDDNILAVDKPAYIVTDRAGDSLESLLRRQLNNPKIVAIHRLDMDTTGVNLFAKKYEVFEAYKTMWQDKAVEKIYFAVSTGEAHIKTQTVKEPIDGKEAVSRISLVAKGYGLSVFKIGLETGRKHQIRIHLKHLGYPVLGDKTYGPHLIESEWKKNVKRQILHARQIAFTDPISGNNIVVSSPFPKDFREIAEKTGWNPGTINPKL